jgi:ferredoxin-like protein FixX
MGSDVIPLLKRLSLNKYVIDDEPHIRVDSSICVKCQDKPCVKVCPAGTYEPLPDGRVAVHYERCLECGASLIACPYGAITFKWPKRGVSYTYG